MGPTSFSTTRMPRIGASLIDKLGGGRVVTLVEILSGEDRSDRFKSGKPGLPTYWVNNPVLGTYGRCCIYFEEA